MLKYISLSGSTEVNENLHVYEYGDDMIVIDCGIGFPDSEMFGVDIVLPDFSYVVKNKHKLRGILISHGHEDHYGALPFFVKDVNTTIYATKLVGGFVQEKLEDFKIQNQKVSVFDPDRDILSLGVFKITPFRVGHSVPDGVGFCIDTPEGKMFHVPDYKFDWTPVDGRPFDAVKVASLASGGVLSLASDSLGAGSPGYTESEKEIEGRIEDVVRDVKGKVYLTTISSNISRMQQTINAAERLGRKVVFIGRSIIKKSEIARNLGYMNYKEDLVISPKEAAKYPDNKLIFVISGCYGQAGSALYRLALGEHQFLSVSKGDAVVFTADPAPPGSKGGIDFLVDKFIEQDIDVHYYDLQEDLHVSGHGSQKDIQMLFGLVKPKYYIPIGGTIRHSRSFSLLAQGMGAKEEEVLALPPGQVVEFSNQVARFTERIPVKEVLVDGLGIGDVGNVVLRDRQHLSKEGIVIVMIHFDRTQGVLSDAPELISRGFVFEKKYGSVLEEASDGLVKTLGQKKTITTNVARNTTIDFLERFFFKKMQRRPMILPLVVEV